MITIIIPSYNQAPYLPEAIESALDQTADCEVIVIDDGSTDNSLQIAKSYALKYPLKVIAQVNKGLSSARNTGIMNAHGDWILPLDADDVLLPNCVERVEKAITETEADIIGLSLRECGLGSAEIYLMSNPQLKDFESGNRLGYCSAVKKSALLEIGGYSPRMVHGYEDLHLWINLLSLGKKVVTIPEVLWLYRIKENSMIHDARKHHHELLTQIKKDFPQWQPTF